MKRGVHHPAADLQSIIPPNNATSTPRPSPTRTGSPLRPRAQMRRRNPPHLRRARTGCRTRSCVIGRGSAARPACGPRGPAYPASRSGRSRQRGY
eukprot:gene1957-biopygen18435